MHFDITLKDLLLAGQGTLLSRILGRPVRVARVLPTEFPSTGNRRPDLLFELAGGELLHIEVQAQPDPRFPTRNLGYRLAICEVYGCHPTQVVLWVGSGPVAIADRIEGEGLRYGYTVLDVKTLEAEPFLRSESVDEAVFGLLCANPDVRRTVARLLNRLVGLPRRKQQDLIEKLMVLCNLRACRDVREEEVAQMPVRIDLSDDPWIVAAMERGRSEGRGEGRVETRRHDLLRILQRDFGKLPVSIETRIRNADLDELDRWFEGWLSGAKLNDLFS